MAQKDNGIFWIDFESVVARFEFMDINWNPELLVYRKSLFDMWPSALMKSDDYNISNNPQYSVEFSGSAQPTDIISWVIISRLSTPAEDEEEKTGDVLSPSLSIELYGNACFQ